MRGVGMLDREIEDSLTLLCGYPEMLLDGSLGPLTKEQRVALESLADRANRLVHLFRERTNGALPGPRPAKSDRHPKGPAADSRRIC
jgi:hypothetical protein